VLFLGVGISFALKKFSADTLRSRAFKKKNNNWVWES